MHYIIPQIKEKVKAALPKKPSFWLHFSGDGDGTEWIEAGLPMPNYLLHRERGRYDIGWQVDGYFATKKSIEYVNDVIARIVLTLGNCRLERLPWSPPKQEEQAHRYPIIYRLADFDAAESLPRRQFAPSRADALGGRDYAFWAIKLWTEDRIREYGEGAPVPYSTIESWAMQIFVDGHRKERSTIRAKCRSIWQYYDDRAWRLPKKRKTDKTEEEIKMTRQDHARRLSANRAEQTRKKIWNALSGMFSDELKKKNGKWNIAKIAAYCDVSRDSAAKYVAEFEALKNDREKEKIAS